MELGNRFTNLFLLSVLGMLGLGTGCCPNYEGRNIVVSLSPEFTGNSKNTVLVDLIRVNASDYARWKNMDMRAYWDPSIENSARTAATRQGRIVRLKFDRGTTQTLEATNPIYKSWSSADIYLFALANTPADATSLPGSQDPRRCIFPADNCALGKDPTKLELTPSGWHVLTPPARAWQEP